MEPWLQMVVTIVCAVIASSGFWAFIQKKNDNKDVKSQMLIGLAHDRIIFLGMHYIERGWITQDEYENLYEYLYKPYEKLGGNGSAQRIMMEVKESTISCPNGSVKIIKTTKITGKGQTYFVNKFLGVKEETA